MTAPELKAPHPAPPCNICGGATYGPGPGGRMSATGTPPRCETCQSLERHRTLRKVHDQLRQFIPYEEMSCLQLSVDRAIESSWFASRLVSEYDVTHSLDIQSLGLPSRSFDVVICNHVLEHVENDQQAMAELLRVVTDRGLLQVAFPDPARNARTRDWGYPNWDDHGHYRIYGMDVCEKLRTAADGAYFVQFPTADPTTNMQDIYFFMTRSDTVAEVLRGINDRAIIEGGDRRKLTPVRAPDLVQERLVRDPDSFNDAAIMGEFGGEETLTTAAQRTDQLLMSEVQRRVGSGGHTCFLGAPDAGDFLSLTLARRLGEKVLTTHDPATEPAPDAVKALVQGRLSPDPDVVALTCDFGKLHPREVEGAIMGKARLALCTPAGEGVVERHRLNLAGAVLAPGGLIIVSGFLSADRPGATVAALAHFARTPQDKLRPVAMSDERLYLTDATAAPGYLTALQEMITAGAAQGAKTRIFGADIITFTANPKAFAPQPLAKGGLEIAFDASDGVEGAGGRVYPLRIADAAAEEVVTLKLDVVDAVGPVEVSATGASDAIVLEGERAEAALSVDLGALGASRRVEVRIAPGEGTSAARLVAARLA